MRKWNDDPFTKKARQEDYKARSVYKLAEIDKKERLLAPAKIIVDLGASPGSWSQYCLEKSKAKIYAVDLNPLKIEDPRLIFVEGSFDTVDYAQWLEGKKADLVISDMAPKTTGIHDSDVAFSFELAEGALNVARKILRKDGNFVTKLFMGGSFEEYQKELRKHFASTRVIRPESVRKQSREIFLVGRLFKGTE